MLASSCSAYLLASQRSISTSTLSMIVPVIPSVRGVLSSKYETITPSLFSGLDESNITRVDVAVRAWQTSLFFWSLSRLNHLLIDLITLFLCALVELTGDVILDLTLEELTQCDGDLALFLVSE